MRHRAATEEPFKGVKQAHKDFVAFLYLDHGEFYDDKVGEAEALFGVPREKIAYGLFGILALYLVVGAAAEIVCNVIGFAYPAYRSVKAVRSTHTHDDTQWLIYWCVFAMFSIIDYFSGSIMQYFPLYWLCKVTFLVYLFLPQTMGAQYLFYNYVDPMIAAFDESFRSCSHNQIQ